MSNIPDFQTILIYVLPVLFAITVHEAAHGYAARYFGDNTAYMLGRISLNPLKHIDPIGTIAMPLALYLLTDGAFVFGYAKPVPINTRNLRNPKNDMIWVALAGPMSNFIQAILWALLFFVLLGSGADEPFFVKMAAAGISINLVLWALNLLPIPPLDGGRILVGLLPWKQAQQVARIEPFGFFIVIALVMSGILSSYWTLPLIKLAYGFIENIIKPIIDFFI